MLKTLKLLLCDDEGATMVEYGLVVSLVAMVCIVAVTLIGTDTSTFFNSVAGSI